MKCSHTGHPFPHRLLIFLTRGSWTPIKFSLLHNLVRLSPLWEHYQLSLTTLGDYRPLERITTSGDYRPLERATTSLSLLWGLYPPREDNHLSLITLGNYHPLERIITSSLATLGDFHSLISPTITLGDYQPQHKVTCTSSVTPFPHNYSGLVVCFHSKGYGLGTLMARNCTKH